ncbi:MAG TPA: tetratricopeptide repeat protein [Thermoanaerobaculaceae bacterium]|nr:tetratricopeptide repeat protein [Thermoanaerobaculaceae bacterium]HRS16167.1 tetratricopeptide repeat protein [Thermoanaerobaculaceae bacterium]
MQPDRIGRYRLDRLLAEHATWESYSGWDEQLDRPVLVARVPLEGVDPEEREVWRRDVQALSGITHPGLVHVLDILHQHGCDWVVSEWVEGEPVDGLAARQPLAGCEVARLGAELAETLAVLHQHAVRHGDLRPANVLVTSEGHVKLGGGCAPFWQGSESTTPPGTTPASAGQAGPASDLRGLGEVLLAATGARPGGTPTPHPTAALLAPTCGELAGPLASVISRCLRVGYEPPFESARQAAAALRALDALSHQATLVERHGAVPAPRRRRLVTIGAAITLAAVLVGVAAWRLLALRRPLAVAVMPVEAPRDSEEARLAALAVDVTITTSLATLPDLVMVNGREVRALRTKGVGDVEIARRLAVQETVEIKLSRVTGSTGPVIELARRRARDRRVVWTQRLQASTWEPAVVRELVGELLSGAYRKAYRSAQARFSKASPAAVKTYLDVVQRHQNGTFSPGLNDEIALLESAIEDSPGFAEAWELLVSYQGYRCALTLQPEDRTAFESKRDRALAHGASPMVIGLIESQLRVAVGDTSGGLAVARELVRQVPGNPQAWQRLGEALSRAGLAEEAEAALARSTQLYPSSSSFASLALARSDRGDHPGARAALAKLRSLLGLDDRVNAVAARIEMYAGNVVEAERLYTELNSKRPTSDGLNNLGFCLFCQGKLAQAADAFERARAIDTRGYLATRNLADVRMAQGDTHAARVLYQQALAAIQPLLARSVAPRTALATQAVCLAQLGRPTEAATAVDAMLKASPDHPETVFTAALVAAVTGERVSALAWTRRALELHAPVVWFQTPEFNRLRTDPEFARLTSREP